MRYRELMESTERKFYVSGFPNRRGYFRITGVIKAKSHDGEDKFEIEMGKNAVTFMPQFGKPLRFRDNQGKPMSIYDVENIMNSDTDEVTRAEHEAWQEKTAAKRQGIHYHESKNNSKEKFNEGSMALGHKGMMLSMDRNGNSILKIKPKDMKGFSIQTNGNLVQTHRDAMSGNLNRDSAYGEAKEFVSRYGTPRQKAALEAWANDYLIGEGLRESGDMYDDMEWGDAEVRDIPQEDDGYIQDNVRHGYDASLEGKFVGNYHDAEEAYHAIRNAAGQNFFPTIWFVDDHGGMEPYHPDVNETELDTAGNWDFQTGDEVHLGFGHKGGAGYFGTIKSIEDDEVIITSDEGRMFKGPIRFLTPVEVTGHKLMANRRPRAKAQQRIQGQHLDVDVQIDEELDFGMDKFTLAYCEAMLWAETDEEEVPLEVNYDIDDFAPEALARIKKDCEAFQARANLEELQEEMDTVDVEVQAGHDFWLTRAGHGAGFWDGDWPQPHGDRLTNLSTSFGHIDVYVGDDGKLYL